MKRCDGPECETIVNERGIFHVRLGDKLFCGADCGNAWLSSQGLRVVRDSNKAPSTALVRVNGHG